MKYKFNLRTQSMYMFTTVIKYFLTLINVRCLVLIIIFRFDRQYLSINIGEFTFTNIYNLYFVYVSFTSSGIQI